MKDYGGMGSRKRGVCFKGNGKEDQAAFLNVWSAVEEEE